MFNILRMGYDTTHDKNFAVYRQQGYKFYLLLIVKTEAIFTFDNLEVLLKPNTFILYEPNHTHCYKAYSNIYKNDWIHFECSDFELSNSIPPVNTPINISNNYYAYDLIQKIAKEFFSNNKYRSESINHLLSLLLLKTKELSENLNYKEQNSLMEEKLVKLRSEIFSNPSLNWNISMMAKKLNISCGHLHNIYKNLFGTSCISEVIESRINFAKHLLVETDLMIYEIASLSGYKNEYHFMRQFKKSTNLSPSAYRKLKK